MNVDCLAQAALVQSKMMQYGGRGEHEGGHLMKCKNKEKSALWENLSRLRR